MEPKENVEEREEDKEKFDVIKKGENLVLLLSRVEVIVKKLKGLEAHGNEKAGKALRSIEESLKPKENKINK